MEFRKGEKWNLNKRQGEGVECSIQSSYHSPEKIKNLIKDVFWFFDLKRFFISWDLNETYLISFENYIRYNEKKEKEVVKVIKEVLQLIGLCEDYRLSYSVEKKREGYKFAKLTSDKWYLLGFERKPFFFFLKSYRGKEYPNIKDPVLRHPKLEIGLDVKYNKNNRPKWSEWPKILAYMALVRNSIAIQSGLTIEDLIEDDYFKVQPEEVKIINPIDLKKLETYYLDRVKEIYPVALNDNTKRKLLMVLAQKISVDTAELKEAVGLSRQQIFNLISYFEEKGVIGRFRSNRTFIEFINPLIAQIMEEKLKLIDNLAPIEEKTASTTQKHKITIDKSSSGEGGVFRLLYEASSDDTVNIPKKELLEEYLAKKGAFTGVA